MENDSTKVTNLFPKWQALFNERFTEGSDWDRQLWCAIHVDDDIGFILRVHLLFEFGLNWVLAKHGKQSDDTFARTLRRAFEAGLIEKPMRDTLSAINQLRNKYAHTLNYEISEAEMEELIEVASRSADVEDDADGIRSRLRMTIAWVSNAFTRAIGLDSEHEQWDEV